MKFIRSAEPEYLYLNIYDHTGGTTIGHYHSTRAEADKAARGRDDRVSCIRVEFRNGQMEPEESFFLNINKYGDSYTISKNIFKNRASADSAKTRTSERIACARVPLVKGRFDA